MVKKLWNLFIGKKTYLAAALTVVVVGLEVFGIINHEIFKAAVVLLGAMGLWALRLGVDKK